MHFIEDVLLCGEFYCISIVTRRAQKRAVFQPYRVTKRLYISNTLKWKRSGGKWLTASTLSRAHAW